MKRTSVISLGLAAILIICLGAGLTAVATNQGKGKKGSGPTYLATLEINDDFSGTLLSSDGKGLYVDWRLDGDPCVKAKVEEKGFFFIWFYRGSDFGADCEGPDGKNLPPDKIRRYRLPGSICAALGLGGDPCEPDRQAIRAENLFSKNAIETPISFIFHVFHNDEEESYTLDTEGDITGSGDIRTVTNAWRTAQLWKFPPKGSHPKEKPQPVGDPFFFPFQLTVTRVAQ